MEQLLSENGAEALLGSLEDSLSNAIRIGERQAVEVDAFTRVLDRLYSEHVQRVAVRPFETHLPLFSLRLKELDFNAKYYYFSRAADGLNWSGDLGKDESKTFAFIGVADAAGSFHYELALRELVQPFDYVNDHSDGADVTAWDETVAAT